MCFIENDDYCEVYTQKISGTRKPKQCISCNRTIGVGEQRLTSFYIFEGEKGGWDMCNQCAQDYVAIRRAELRRGCGIESALPPVDEVRRIIRRGNPDEYYEPEFEGDREPGDEYDPVLFWPYDVPPAHLPIDLKLLPELV